MTNPTKEQIQEVIDWIETRDIAYCESEYGDWIPFSCEDRTLKMEETIDHVLKQALDPWCYDMSKAPRDGTELLVKDGCHVRMVHYELNASFGNCEYDNGWQEFNCGDDDFYSTAYRTEELSAWMLIPKGDIK